MKVSFRFFIALLLLNQLMAGTVSAQNQHPWIVGEDWTFTWHVSISNVTWQQNTKTKLLITSIDLLDAGNSTERWIMKGNLSRYLFLSGSSGQWVSVKENAVLATYNTLGGSCVIGHDALVDNTLFILDKDDVFEPMGIFKTAMESTFNTTEWDMFANESSRQLLVMNKTNSLHRYSYEFTTNGVLNNLTETSIDGSILFEFILENEVRPWQNWALYFNVLTFTGIGAAITIAILILFRKYKIKAENVVRT